MDEHPCGLAIDHYEFIAVHVNGNRVNRSIGNPINLLVLESVARCNCSLLVYTVLMNGEQDPVIRRVLGNYQVFLNYHGFEV